MSVTAAVTIDDLRAAAQAGGGLIGELVTDDVEFTEIDQRTPPVAPGVHHGRSALRSARRAPKDGQDAP